MTNKKITEEEWLEEKYRLNPELKPYLERCIEVFKSDNLPKFPTVETVNADFTLEASDNSLFLCKRALEEHVRAIEFWGDRIVRIKNEYEQTFEECKYVEKRKTVASKSARESDFNDCSEVFELMDASNDLLSLQEERLSHLTLYAAQISQIIFNDKKSVFKQKRNFKKTIKWFGNQITLKILHEKKAENLEEKMIIKLIKWRCQSLQKIFLGEKNKRHPFSNRELRHSMIHDEERRDIRAITKESNTAFFNPWSNPNQYTELAEEIIKAAPLVAESLRLCNQYIRLVIEDGDD